MDKIKIKTILLEKQVVTENIYLDKYLELIMENSNNLKANNYQKHHIIPKSFYTMFSLKVNNKKENIIYLSKKNHILAHYYLSKCSTGKFKANNVYAVICLCRTSNFKDSEYLILSEDEFNKFVQEHNRNISSRMKGKKFSEEHNRRLSESLRRNKVNVGERNPMYGKTRISPTKNRIWIHNYEVQKMININELSTYIELGYVKGRLRHR